MKHIRRILFWFGVVSLLLGCSVTSPKTNEAEPTHIVPSSTMNRTSTPATTFTPSLPTATLTSTATPTQPSIPTLISDRNSANYQSTKPSPEGLLQLIDIIGTQHNYFNSHFGYQDNPKFEFMLDELSALRNAIDHEILYYYPNGFSEPEIAWGFYPPEEERWFPFISPVYLDLLSDAVLVDLDHHHSKLSDQEMIKGKGYEAKVYEVEIDHDSSPEWLIRIEWTEIDSLSWLALDQKSDLSFTKISSSLPSTTWNPSEDQIQALRDFTGDGLTDIIFLDYGYVWGTDFGTFYINQGTKNGFKPLNAIGVSIPGYLSEGLPFTIEVPSGSRWLSLSISDPHNINWGCKWDTITSYRWPFGVEQVKIRNKNAPDAPDCYLARAVSLSESPDNRTAANLIENAIPRFDKNDADFRAKLSFAHYRLAILYAIMGKDSFSRQHIEGLMQNLNESDVYFKSGLRSLLDGSTINPIDLCDLMYSAPDAEVPEEWEKFVNATAAFNAYPYSPEIYPPVICALREIITDKLNKVDWSSQPLSEKALTDQGIPVAAIQSYSFPDEKHPASFMLIGAKTLYVLGYVPTQNGWEWRLMETFDSINGLPQTFSQDVTGDGFPELAYFQQSQDVWGCPENEQGYKIFLTTSSDFGFVSLSRTVCHSTDQSFEITDYLPDADRDGVVDWVTDQIREAGGDSFLTAERDAPATWFTPDEIRSMIPEQNTGEGEKADLISQLYESRNPSIVRRRLIDERNALNLADPFAGRTWQKLTYLIAVSYEMEGKKDEAIEVFTSILQSKDQTLWGNLAELHLTPKQ